MTETDFFRMMRERAGDYSITITRISTIGGLPYKAALLYHDKVTHGEGETLPELLSGLARQAGLDRRATARPASQPGNPESDRKWPGG